MDGSHSYEKWNIRYMYSLPPKNMRFDQQLGVQVRLPAERAELWASPRATVMSSPGPVKVPVPLPKMAPRQDEVTEKPPMLLRDFSEV